MSATNIDEQATTVHPEIGAGAAKVLRDLSNASLGAAYPDVAEVKMPVSVYVSPEETEREKQLIFGKAWLYAGFTQDIDEPGKYFIREIPLLRASVIVARGSDGAIRAFHNVCRHRCNRLVVDKQEGRSKRFTCPYHGWTYDLTGRLIGLPDKDGLLEPEKLGLIPVAVDTWCGQIFINLDPAPRQSLKEFLGPSYDWDLTSFDWDAPYESWEWRTELDVNWKVLLDLFSEGYHVRFVHKDSVSRLYTDNENPFCHLPIVDLDERHRRVSVYATLGDQHSPVARMARKFGGDKLSRTRDDGSSASAGDGLNFGKLDNWGFDLYTFLPNFQLTVFGGFWHFHYFMPLEGNRAIWEHRIFFPKAQNAGQRFAQEVSRSLQQIVASEDVAMAESNQRGLETSWAHPFLELHDQEIVIKHTRKVLDDFMAQSQG